MSWGIRIMRGGNNSSKKDLNGFFEWGLDGFFIGINHQRWHGKSWQQQQINSRIFLKNWFSWFCFFDSWQIGMACRIICYPGFNNSFSNIFLRERIYQKKERLLISMHKVTIWCYTFAYFSYPLCALYWEGH